MAGRIIFTETDRVASSDTLLPRPQDISITSTTQTYSSVSQNLSVQTRTRGIQRWQINMNWPPLTRENAMKVYAFFISQQGTFGSFQVSLPGGDGDLRAINTSAGSQVNNTAVEGVPMVSDTRSTIARSVDVGNFNPSRDADNPAMKAGDFFKFSNHEKLYMVTQDVTTNNLGRGNIKFTPPLISSVAFGIGQTGTPDLLENGTTIIHEKPEITMSLKTEEFEIPIDEHVFYAMSVEMGERVTSTSTPTA